MDWFDFFQRKALLYRTITSSVNEVRMQKFHSCSTFFYAFSFADSQNSMGRKERIFIPLYHFYQLTNIQAFICSFAYEMTTFKY